MSLLKTLLPPLLLAVLTDGQVHFPGKCPDRAAVSQFDLDVFKNGWFYYKRWQSQTVKMPDISCTMVFFKREGTTSFKLTEYLWGVARIGARGTYVPSKVQGKPASDARFTRLDDGENTSPPFYNILSIQSTASYSYAIIWWCEEDGAGGNRQGLIVLTRKKSPGKQADATIMQDMERLNLNKTYLRKVNQMNCITPKAA